MTMKRIAKQALAAVILMSSVAAPLVAVEYDDAYARGDYATTFRLIRPLADHGDASAQYRLGAMYAQGQGVTQDYVFAMIWYRKAADQGYADAQYALGLMYSNGYGDVPPNFVLAHAWLSLSTVRLNDDAARFAAIFSPENSSGLKIFRRL
jgi:uncharacterized protein